MQMRIGLVGQRADLAVEVASLAMRAGAVVVPVDGPGSLDPMGRVDLLLVDVDALEGPRHPDALATLHPDAVICRSGEGARATAVADRLGCPQVVEIPLAAAWLEGQLAPNAGSSLLGVLGAAGGVGATTAAIACAVGAGCHCLLVDADPHSAGLDLPLGIPEGSGVRWAQVPDAAVPLDPRSLRSALPQVAGCSVVTGPAAPGPHRWGTGPSAAQLAGVLGVGREHCERTVVDLGRGPITAGPWGPGDAAVVVVPATLAGVVAARGALEGLPDRRVVLVRDSPWLATADVAEQLGVDDVLEIPRLRRAPELADSGDLLSGRTGRRLRSLGERVWEHLG